MRLLYLDDSGKTDPKHSSRFLLFAGISFDDSEWANVHRRITGAKVRYFPNRAGGHPNEWELKASDFLTRNAWQRKKNRDFCFELASILDRSHCSVYAVAVEKARATRALDETWLVPLIFQRITAKFVDELTTKNAMPGALICDWTSYKLDHHISACVQSYAVSRGYKIIGGVTYASSNSFTAIQAADLISGAFRRWHEGATYLDPLIQRFTGLKYDRPGAYVRGFPMVSVFRLF